MLSKRRADLRAAAQIFKRETRRVVRRGDGLGFGIAFVALAVFGAPLVAQGDPEVLRRLHPGLPWAAIIPAVLLTCEGLFDPDGGDIEALALSRLSLEATLLIKAATHWIAVAAPLALAASIFGLALDPDPDRVLPAALAAVVGAISLSLLAALAAAIVSGLRNGGLLASLFALPLYLPAFAVGLEAAEINLADPDPESTAFKALAFLVAFAAVLAVVAPVAAAAALRDRIR